MVLRRIAVITALTAFGLTQAGAQDIVYRCGPEGARSEDVSACEFGDVIELPGLDFASGSAQLTARAAGILDGLAAELKTHGRIRLEVAGHTDNSGSAKGNRSLSRRRASTVRTYLILKGVDEGRLTAQGYGDSSPIADNATAQGRKKNRRVEIRVVG